MASWHSRPSAPGLRPKAPFRPLAVLLLLALAGCRGCAPGGPALPAPDVSAVPAGLRVIRADRLLEAPDRDAFAAAWDTLYRRHPAFAVYYRDWILRAPMPPGTAPTDTAVAGTLWRTYAEPPLLRGLADTLRRRLTGPGAGLDAALEELRQAYRYHRHYRPQDTLPPVYLYSGVFGAPVEWTPDFQAVALTMFLGRDFSGYKGFPSENLPRYLFHRLEAPYLPVRVMETEARARWQPVLPTGSALEHVIYEGKILAYLDRVFPRTADSLKIGFTDRQIAWAALNAEDAWALMVTEELLFSTRLPDIQRLVGEGPHTKGMTQESPARMGSYIGWQIVRAWWRRHPDATLEELFGQTDARKFLEASGWKP
jgi:hypothetical protein